MQARQRKIYHARLSNYIYSQKFSTTSDSQVPSGLRTLVINQNLVPTLSILKICHLSKCATYQNLSLTKMCHIPKSVTYQNVPHTKICHLSKCATYQNLSLVLKMYHTLISDNLRLPFAFCRRMQRFDDRNGIQRKSKYDQDRNIVPKMGHKHTSYT